MRTSVDTAPLASRVVGRTLLEGLKLMDMAGYLKHHLEVASGALQLFSEEAITAIHQGSGGLPRTANALARGALIAAACEKATLVAADHKFIQCSPADFEIIRG